MALTGKFIAPGGDPLYVNITGDTMTGPLILSRAPELNLEAATKAYADAVLQDAKDYVEDLLQGTSKWFAGSGEPSNTVGSNSDLYLNTTSTEVYHKVTGSWTLKGMLLSTADKYKLDNLNSLIEQEVRRQAFVYGLIL